MRLEIPPPGSGARSNSEMRGASHPLYDPWIDYKPRPDTRRRGSQFWAYLIVIGVCALVAASYLTALFYGALPVPRLIGSGVFLGVTYALKLLHNDFFSVSRARDLRRAAQTGGEAASTRVPRSRRRAP